MKKSEMKERVLELRRLREERNQLDALIESIEDDIKTEMNNKKKYEYSGDGWKVTWNEVTQHRLDQSSLKEEHPKLYERYLKEISYRKFYAK